MLNFNTQCHNATKPKNGLFFLYAENNFLLFTFVFGGENTLNMFCELQQLSSYRCWPDQLLFHPLQSCYLSFLFSADQKPRNTREEKLRWDLINQDITHIFTSQSHSGRKMSRLFCSPDHIFGKIILISAFEPSNNYHNYIKWFLLNSWDPSKHASSTSRTHTCVRCCLFIVLQSEMR